MSILVPSSIAPAPSASPGGKAPARAVEPDQNQPGSFGEVLARSRQPAAEKSSAKAATPTPARRQADTEKTEPQDLVSPLAALLLPLESRMAATKLPVSSAPSGDRAVVQGDAALSDPLAETPLPEGAMAEAPEMAAGTDTQVRQATLAVMLAAAGPKSAGQTPVQAGDADVQDGPVIAANPRALAATAATAAAAAPVGAAGADLAEPSSKQGEKDAVVAGISGNAPADQPLLATDDTAGTSNAWLLQPAGAALQTPAGVSAANTPAPVATALLAPPVGSSEWSKALGQQVIHMGTADHQVAELQLNPPGLGPLKVTLSMNDQQMQAMFVSAHSSVRAAVEAALPQLRAQLAESGISLGNTSVGAESQPQTAFANGQNGQGGQPQRGAYRPAGTDPATVFADRPATAQVRSSQGLRIDTYA